MFDLFKTTPKSVAVQHLSCQSDSLATDEASPVSILVQSKEKRHGRVFEDIVSLTSIPQSGSQEDTTKVRKKVHWRDVVQEITLPCCKIRHAECKYVQLNDVKQVEHSKEEDSTTPVMPAAVPDVTESVTPQDICASRSRGSRSVHSLTSSRRTVTERQRRKPRSYSDSQVQRLTRTPITPARWASIPH